jgi:hypothetical protein
MMRVKITPPTNAFFQATAHWGEFAGEASDCGCCGRVGSDIARSRGLQRLLLADFHMAGPVRGTLPDVDLSEGEGARVSISDLGRAARVHRPDVPARS